VRAHEKVSGRRARAWIAIAAAMLASGAALASEASSQRGDLIVPAHSASEDARERAGDTRPEPGSSARGALAQGRTDGPADAGEIRGLKLGLAAQSMPLRGFGDLACGSNGGPPRQKIDEWTEFGKCRPEDNGLHEVYIRFDDEDDYIGRAIEEPRYARGKTGTRVAGHAVILSALFDRGGVVRGLRFVTDPRAAPNERRMSHLLRLAVINRYAADGWICTDFPPADGESPVGGVLLKQRCEKATPERHLMVEARFLRKPGQADVDPITGETRPGAYESWTRFEIFDPSYVKR
jgi:hypothetical protein